jgi:hypothetical protein
MPIFKTPLDRVNVYVSPHEDSAQVAAFVSIHFNNSAASWPFGKVPVRMDDLFNETGAAAQLRK